MCTFDVFSSREKHPLRWLSLLLLLVSSSISRNVMHINKEREKYEKKGMMRMMKGRWRWRRRRR